MGWFRKFYSIWGLKEITGVNYSQKAFAGHNCHGFFQPVGTGCMSPNNKILNFVKYWEYQQYETNEILKN